MRALINKKSLSIFLPALMLTVIACNKVEPYRQQGEASYYARLFQGRETASGSIFSNDSLTAAHRELPLGTIVKVTNTENGKSVKVEINDRGPYNRRRIIDLSRKAATKLDFLEEGEAQVELEVVEPAPGYTVADSVARP
jgi:rare lipoprotein A